MKNVEEGGQSVQCYFWEMAVPGPVRDEQEGKGQREEHLESEVMGPGWTWWGREGARPPPTLPRLTWATSVCPTPSRQEAMPWKLPIQQTGLFKMIYLVLCSALNQLRIPSLSIFCLQGSQSPTGTQGEGSCSRAVTQDSAHQWSMRVLSCEDL